MPRLRHALISSLVAFVMIDGAAAATFTVITNADSGPGSLRQAILDSNANGLNDSDDVVFAIPGAGPHVIALTTALPPIQSRTFTIDGYTQPGASPNTRTTAQGGLDTQLRVVVSGANVPGGGDGLLFQNGNQIGVSTVRGLSLIGFLDHIRVFSTIGDLIVEGNYIGVDPAGNLPQVDRGGLTGVNVVFPQANVRIGGLLPAQRNLVSGRNRDDIGGGVGIDIGAVNTNGRVTVQGNLIGTDPGGTVARGFAIGVRVAGVASDSQGVQIGGADPNARNVISANGFNGITLRQRDGIAFLIDRVVIEGNWIGTDASGLLPLANGTSPQASAPAGSPPGGIIYIINSAGNSTTRIGGSAPGAANRIAFNRGNGVRVVGFGTAGSGKTVEIGENQIFLNTEIPFDNADLPRANDVGDADVGANRVQNFPQNLSAQRQPGIIDVSYLVDTAPTNATYPLRVDFYRSNPSGDALALVGTTSIAAADAQTTRSVALSSASGIGFLTAIATDAAGNSSEFSDVLDIDRVFMDGFE